MAVGEVYCLKLFSSMYGQNMLNVFNYAVGAEGGVPSTAAELAIQFNSVVLDAIATVQDDAVAYQSIECFSWEDPADFWIIETQDLEQANGLAAGSGNVPSMAWSFRYTRQAFGQRSGSKRFSGVTESDVSGYNVEPATLAFLNALATVLGSALGTLSVAYVPFVAKRPLVLGERPAGYVTQDVQFAGIGTQNSRKRPLSAQ